MTKDEQIGHLFGALENIAYGYMHSTGEDAEDMRNEAKEAIDIWRNAIEASQPKNSADSNNAGSCSKCGKPFSSLAFCECNAGEPLI